MLLCRHHHVLWHLGKVQLRHLTVPWHPDQQTAAHHHIDDLFPDPAAVDRSRCVAPPAAR